MPGNPFASQPERQRAADHRVRHAQPVPVRLPAGHERAVGRRRRLEHVGGDQPDPERDRTRWRRTSAGRATRAAAGSPATTARTSTSASRCTPAPGRTRRTTRTTTARTVAPGDGCPTGGSSISGIAFESTSNYPAAYDGALFFADSSRGCIWAMRKGANGLPDPAQIVPFVTGVNIPVHLTTGPGGDLFYLALGAGQLRRVSYPTARTTRRPRWRRRTRRPAPAPLTVQFTGVGLVRPGPGDGADLRVGPRRRRRVRRLDGGESTVDLRGTGGGDRVAAGDATRAGCRSTASVPISVGQPAEPGSGGHDRQPDRGDAVGGRPDTCRSRGGRRTRRTARCRRPRCAGS